MTKLSSWHLLSREKPVNPVQTSSSSTVDSEVFEILKNNIPSNNKNNSICKNGI